MTKKTRYFLAGSAAVLAAGLGTGLVAYYAGGFQSVSASAGFQRTPLRAGRRDRRRLRRRPGDHGLGAPPAPQGCAADAHEQGQQEFQDQTGIDIEHDIDYVVGVVDDGRAPTSRRRSSSPAAASTTPSSRASIREHGGTVEEYKGKRLDRAAPTGDARRRAPIQARQA